MLPTTVATSFRVGWFVGGHTGLPLHGVRCQPRREPPTSLPCAGDPAWSLASASARHDGAENVRNIVARRTSTRTEPPGTTPLCPYQTNPVRIIATGNRTRRYSVNPLF